MEGSVNYQRDRDEWKTSGTSDRSLPPSLSYLSACTAHAEIHVLEGNPMRGQGGSHE